MKDTLFKLNDEYCQIIITTIFVLQNNDLKGA